MRALFAAGLVGVYVVYVISTFRASAALVDSGHGTEAPERLFVSRLGLPTTLATIVLQFFVGIVLWSAARKGFIHGVEGCRSARACRRCCCR